MAQQFGNFIRTTLRAPLTTSGTQLFLASGTGALFNVITTGNWCYVTINDNSTVEIVKYTSAGAVVNDTITVERAQDNTTAKAFPVGACVTVGWNVAQLLSIVDQEIERLRPPVENELPTPYDFGAVGDGVTDDTGSVNAWLTAIEGGVGYGKAGRFLVSAEMVIHTDTTIWGAGKENCVFLTKPGVTQDFLILRNQNITTDPNNRIDKNINIYDVCFEGDTLSPVDGTTEFVVFVGVDGLTLRGCKFQKRHHSLVDFQNMNNVIIDQCECYDWGIRTYSGSPGQYNGGTAFFFLTPSFNVRITNNWLHYGAGGMWLPFVLPDESLNCICTGNIIEDVKEFGITSPPDRCLISDNVIVNVGRVDVSGHGMELFGNNFTVKNNYIDLCDGSCLVLFDPINVIVSGNIFNRNNQIAATPAGALTVYCLSLPLGGGLYPPSFITIENNNFTNTDGNGKSAVLLSNISGDVNFRISNFHMSDNNFGPEDVWPEGCVNYYPDFGWIIGDNFIRRDNSVCADLDRSMVQFIIPSGQTADVVVKGVGFTPRAIDFRATLVTTGALSLSLGQCGWATGWDVVTQSIISPRTFMSNNSDSWATDGTDSVSTSTGFCIHVLDSLAASICAATVSSLDNDGFTLAMNAASTDAVVVTATCYP